MYEVRLKTNRDIVKGIVYVCGHLTGQLADLEKWEPTYPKQPTLQMDELKMMLLTVAAESSFVHREQIGGGPARGLCGMEPPTARDTFRWLEKKPELWQRLTRIWLGLESVDHFWPTETEISAHLARNDYLALALARLHWKMFAEPFPSALPHQAIYWKKYWNTEAGAGTAGHAIREWKACRCDKLVSYAMKLCYLKM